MAFAHGSLGTVARERNATDGMRPSASCCYPPFGLVRIRLGPAPKGLAGKFCAACKETSRRTILLYVLRGVFLLYGVSTLIAASQKG